MKKEWAMWMANSVDRGIWSIYQRLSIFCSSTHRTDFGGGDEVQTGYTSDEGQKPEKPIQRLFCWCWIWERLPIEAILIKTMSKKITGPNHWPIGQPGPLVQWLCPIVFLGLFLVCAASTLLGLFGRIQLEQVNSLAQLHSWSGLHQQCDMVIQIL